MEWHFLVQIPRTTLSHQEQDFKSINQKLFAFIIEQHGCLTTVKANIGLKLFFCFDEKPDGELFIQVKEYADRESFFNKC